MNPLLIALVTTAAGGAFALLGGWLGNRLGQRTEHEQWLRSKKHESYSKAYFALSNTSAIFSTYVVYGHYDAIKNQDNWEQLQNLELELIMSDPVAEAMDMVLDNLAKANRILLKAVTEGRELHAEALGQWESTNTHAIRNLKRAMQSDLGVRPSDFEPEKETFFR